MGKAVSVKTEHEMESPQAILVKERSAHESESEKNGSEDYPLIPNQITRKAKNALFRRSESANLKCLSFDRNILRRCRDV